MLPSINAVIIRLTRLKLIQVLLLKQPKTIHEPGTTRFIDAIKPAKHMKKAIYALILPLVVAGGLVFANRDTKSHTSINSSRKQRSAADITTERKRWEATPDGIKYKQWEASAAGKKVYDAESKIMNHINAFTNMEAVVTSLTLPPGSRLGFGVMVRMNDEDYILSFGLEESGEFEQLHSLRANDKIIIRSRNVSHAPKYSYPIIAGDYAERDGKILYKRAPRKDGC
jgi:hypothetical protein